MNDDNSIYEFEGKSYVSPTVARDEQTSFIDTLRQTGTENISRINQDTQNLGSQVDPMYGGFTEGTTFEERYATPQTENIVAGLQAAAQQSALSQALTNLQNQWSERYKEAYRNAKIREYNKNNTSNPETEAGDQLDIETDTSPDTIDVNENTNTGVGQAVPTSDNSSSYLAEDGNTYTLYSPTQWETDQIKGHPIEMGRASNGDVRVLNGITYRYILNDQYPNGAWFKQG